MMSKRFPEKIAKRLRLPLIAAPMLSVSGPDLAIAACKAGVIGSFPLANARSIEGVDAWLKQIESALAETAEKTPEHPPAPFCPNLIIKRAEMRAELDALVKHRVEMVITSVGSPAEALGPLHDVGTIVFADVATIHHAEKAIASGVDGLILLTAGAGGQTGWLNPLAFVRATRAIFDGPIVLREEFPMARRCGPPKFSAATLPTWAPSLSRRTRAWPRLRTSRCWCVPGWTT